MLTSPPLLLLLLLLLLLSAFPFAWAQPARSSYDLLDAYHAPLSALTAPRSYYFLEFPVKAGSSAVLSSQPRCEDGSAYGFLLRRGTDEHARKLLVEFGGASGRAASTPWEALREYAGDGDGTFPPLGSCTGISQGFVSLGAGLVGFGGSTKKPSGSGREDVDVPIFLRGEEGDLNAGEASSSTTAEGGGEAGGTSFTERRNENLEAQKAWWEHLGGDHSSVHDWSYLFVPHCTPSSPSATEENVHGVASWVATEFATAGGLDALVVVSGGGRIGGCPPSPTGAPPGPSGGLGALRFAGDVGGSMTSSRALVVVDGATMWKGGNEAMRRDVLRETLRSGNVEVAWVASAMLGENGKEGAFLLEMKQTHRQSFKVHVPSARHEGTDPICPLYAFSDASADDAFSEFVRDVARGMPWGAGSKNEARNAGDDDAADENARLSFLAIFLIISACYVASWAFYFLIDRLRRRRSEDAAMPSPHDLWFLALTKFPVLFLVLSLAVPVVLSWVAYERDGVSVNLDFDSYLDIDTREERTAMQYKALVAYQKESLKEEEGHCRLLYGGAHAAPGPKRERTHKETSGARRDRRRRGLQDYGKRSGRTVVSFFYQNRKGGNVFTPEVLRSIREFEEYLMTVQDFSDFCYGDGEVCYPFNSITPYFFPGGELVDDIDGVLKSFPGSKIALAKMDKYFSKTNLGSNVTLTNVMLNDINGRDRANVQRFLESLHRVLWDLDQSEKYPDLIISWSNGHMQDVEAADALEHDFRWSLAALTFIGLMVFAKVRNIFLVLAGVLGLVLSFTSALYWQHHFDFDKLTAMHVAGIFVMLGIGADDIFLTIDTFEHTKVDFVSPLRDEQAEDGGAGSGEAPSLDDPEIIKQRMVSSYKTAGSMLLVSSMTTAICFFSNIFSALVSIADFGSYMGMVVVLNYIHVMTILPSAIIVYEVHLKPLRRKICKAICCCKKNEVGEPNTTEILDAETGVVTSRKVNENEEEEDGIGGDNIYVGGAVMGLTASSSETGDDWRDHDRSHRGISTPETTTSASENSVENEALHHASDDYNFLNHTEEMTALDRYFVLRHAPFVYSWRRMIVFTSISVAVILGVLAWLNFSLYDGTIIVFKEQYNLGRVQGVVDKYFPHGLVRKYMDEGIDFVGNNDDISVLAGDIDNSFGGTDVLDFVPDSNDGGGGGGAAANPTPSTGAPVASPSTATPTSQPSTSTPPALQNTTSIGSSLPPAARPPPLVSGGGSNPALRPPQQKWYPNWIGVTTRGCFVQLSYSGDAIASPTKLKCCEEYFALDSDPGNCKADIYIEAFKCDGAGFKKDDSAIVPNTAFFICIKSSSAIVGLNYLNSIVITQGAIDLALVDNAAVQFPSFTSSEVVNAHGVLVSSYVPTNVFDYAGAPTKVTGGVVLKTIGAQRVVGHEASFEISVNLRQEIPPPATPPVPGPSAPGPTAPAPSAPSAMAPSPTSPGAMAPGPSSPGAAAPTAPRPAIPRPTVSAPSLFTSQSNNTGVSSPPPPPLWYPDYTARKCFKDGKQPSWMNESPGLFLFDNLIQCCKHLKGDKSLCLGIIPIMPTASNPASPSNAGVSWYPDYTARKCFKDGKQPSWMNESPDVFLFDDLIQCCNHLKGDKSICLGIISTMPTASNPATSPSKDPTLSPTASIAPSLLPTATSLSDTSSPTYQPTKEGEMKYNCPPGLSGKYCLQTSGVKKTYRKREYYAVSIVWGMRPLSDDPNVWKVKDNASKSNNVALDDTLNGNYIDPSEPYIQEWLLQLVSLARNDDSLRLHPQLTWIEAMRDFAVEEGIGFPVAKGLFIGVVELMKMRNSFFRKLLEKEIATKSPGIKGEFLYTSLSVLSEVPDAYTSDLALEEWSNFTSSINEVLPKDLPPVNAQSDVFLDSLRSNAIVDSTVSSYYFANGLSVVIILFFTGNLLLTLFVMLSLLVILLAFAGLVFFVLQIEFGPVESLGVSIFVGLSANYLLHIAHSYHKSNINERSVKIQRAVFVTGSPILWSALSTIGGSVFLFACRTWLLTELGILICTIIGLSLICSVGFLLALVALIGPLPILSDKGKHRNLHSYDLMAVFLCCLCNRAQQAETGVAMVPVEEVENDVERPSEDVLESDTKTPSEECSFSGKTAAEEVDSDIERPLKGVSESHAETPSEECSFSGKTATEEAENDVERPLKDVSESHAETPSEEECSLSGKTAVEEVKNDVKRPLDDVSESDADIPSEEECSFSGKTAASL